MKYKIVHVNKLPEKEKTYNFEELELDTAMFIPEESHSIEAIRMAASRASYEPNATSRRIRYAVRRDVHQGRKGAWVQCVLATSGEARRGRVKRDTIPNFFVPDFVE